MIRARVMTIVLGSLAACASDKDAIEPSACGNVERPTIAPKTLDRSFRGFAAGIASDGTSIYYPGPSEGALLRISKEGGAKPEMLRSTPGLLRIVGHGTRVCWADRTPLIACLVGDGPAFEIARPASGVTILDFDFDDTWVYWLERKALKRAPIDRSADAAVVLQTEEGWGSITVDAGHIVFHTRLDNTVYACDTTDGCARLSALDSYGPSTRAAVGRMAVDAHFVYVPVLLSSPGQRVTGKLRRLALDGSGRADDLALCMDEAPVAVVVDAATAYVLTRAFEADVQAVVPAPTAGCTGSVLAIPLAGGPTRRLARDQKCPWHVTLAPGTVSWLNARVREGELLVLGR